MDADRKAYTFNEWYKPMYIGQRSIISYLFDFEQLKKEKNGYQVHLRSEEQFKQYIEENNNNTLDAEKIEKILMLLKKNEASIEKGFLGLRLSGDADYEVRDDKRKLQKMYMFPNFSLMPVTGNWQLIKSNKRLNCFLGKLKKYWDDEKRSVQSIPYRRGKQYRDDEKNQRRDEYAKELLKAFLDIFVDFNDYCNNMYFLEWKEIDNFTEEEYWNKRKEIAKQHGVKEDKMNENIDEDKFD